MCRPRLSSVLSGLFACLFNLVLLAAPVSDSRGVQLLSAHVPQRIISLAPHLTEMLYTIGAGGQIVGTLAYSDFPAAAKAIPRVGDAFRIDMERLLALRPDLVLAWQSGNSAADIAQLERLGIPVYVAAAPQLAGIADLLVDLGRLTGHQAAADRAAAVYRTGLLRLRQRYQGARPLTVFFEIWNRPLMTVNGQHIISDAIHSCGGRNPFAALQPLAPTVSLEAVLLANPQLIVATSSGGNQGVLLSFWQRWDSLDAVRHQQIYTIPAELITRPSTRILQGVEMLCSLFERGRAAVPH